MKMNKFLKNIFDDVNKVIIDIKEKNKQNEIQRKEDKKAFEIEQLRLRKIRIDEREKEIGRQEASGEFYRRQGERMRREQNRANVLQRRKNFENSNWGLGSY